MRQVGGKGMNTDLMFSSKSDEWETPQGFYDDLNIEFNFTLDPCANCDNHKTPYYFSKHTNGLSQDWSGNVCFVNPPYSQIKLWVKKCYEESIKPNTKVVLLIPARTDTRYFHEYIYKPENEIRFIKGRLKFSNSKNSAPFPSIVVIFNNKSRRIEEVKE